MSKTSAPRLVADNAAIASVRDIKGSHTKAHLVMDLIRGKPVERALNELTFCRKRMAGITKKLLLSAIANAENNHSLNVDKLVVAQAYADKAAVLKRWNPRARGRAAGIVKARCHLTLVVQEQEAKKAAAKPAPKKAAAPKAEAKPVKAKAEAKQPETTEKTEA